ncbi:hypothetical protein SLEP1_g21343 [Rubroshorea leprosula]|uniref:Uncharacterized protein n=1 Tax=Rubroshorea leprosula TaxID=152421 RepID=A0AAV5JG66_9ROSI|nr:hypothetical protein SLEP1_g21343 [Rubroshorea leprosula]
MVHRSFLPRSFADLLHRQSSADLLFRRASADLLFRRPSTDPLLRRCTSSLSPIIFISLVCSAQNDLYRFRVKP